MDEIDMINFSLHGPSVLSCSVMSDSLQPHVPHQGPLSMGFSHVFPFPVDLLKPEIKPTSPASPALAGGFCTT